MHRAVPINRPLVNTIKYGIEKGQFFTLCVRRRPHVSRPFAREINAPFSAQLECKQLSLIERINIILLLTNNKAAEQCERGVDTLKQIAHTP